MRSKADFVQPPRVSIWLVNLFTPAEEAESILGDLLEEYSQLRSQSGVAFARSWYWRQTVKTIAHLVGAGYRVAPWSTAAAVVGGYLLGGFLHELLDKILSAVTDRYLAYWSTHFKAYMFWATDGMLIGNLIASMLVGCVVALAARGREMVAAMTLSFLVGAMAVAGSLVMVAKTGHDWFLWTLPWHFARLSAPILIGAAIVRTRRSAPSTRPSAP